MQNNVVRIGLIGLGRMGQNHLRVLSILKSVEICFIYDTNQDTAKLLGKNYGVTVASNLEFEMAKVDAVLITSPTITHFDYVKMAASHVRHIFVEKPLADNLADAEALKSFADEMSLNVQVGFIERFNPAVQQLKKILDNSTQVVNVDFTRTNKIDRITDVDVITDLMIHDIDLAMYLNGPVTAITAHGEHEGNHVGFALALLTHDNGRFSRIQASRITDKKIRSIQATCKDMYIDCDLLRKEINITKQSQTFKGTNEPYIISSQEEFVEVRPQEALLLELQAFISSIQGDEVDRPDTIAGRDSMIVCERIQQAITS
jgi:predicted dehydrogenase